MEAVAFYGLGAVALAMAAAVVFAESPLRSALALIVTQCALAGVYVLLQAPFVAAMQVLVYAGAIMVLFLFVIMLLGITQETLPSTGYLAVVKSAGAAAMVGLCATAAYAGLGGPAAFAQVDGSIQHVGAMLLGPYLFAFEATSVLLLTAVVGSIVLNLKRLT